MRIYGANYTRNIYGVNHARKNIDQIEKNPGFISSLILSNLYLYVRTGN